MSFTVYQTNKKTGVVYAYLQTAYRDPVTGRPKSKRTYLGRVDPVTKKVVPKGTDGRRNRSKLGTQTILDEDRELSTKGICNQEEVDLIKSQRLLIEKLSAENNRLREKLGQIRSISAEAFD